MPNWCSNTLTITGPKADVQAFKVKAVGHSPESKPQGNPDVLNFHSLVPVPENLLATGYDEARYNWKMANWGCKWGASGPGIVDEWEGHVEYEFYTAWSPPIELLQRAGVQWPTLVFLLDYEEPGLAFKGRAKFQGEVHEDHCISL